MSQVSKIEKAIVTIEFMVKKKRDRIEEMSRRTDLNQGQRIFIGEEESLISAINMLVKRYRDDVNRSMGKLPPQALDLEETVLGAVILENKMGEVSAYLKERHFYHESHKLIYRALLAMHFAGDPIDMRTVFSNIRKSGHAEAIGGAYKIAELTSKVSSSVHVEFHARILIEMAMKREMILLAGNMLNDAYEDKVDCFDLLESSEQHLNEIKEWTKK